MGRSTEQRAVRADFDADTIVVYQAFSDRIADAAMAAGRLVAPFSRGRMSWIKPSFRWLMVRSQWASKPGQTRILALRIPRTAWEDALAESAPPASVGEPSQPAPPAEPETAPAEASSGSETEMEFEHFALH